jgi:hypothetical protein
MSVRGYTVGVARLGPGVDGVHVWNILEIDAREREYFCHFNKQTKSISILAQQNADHIMRNSRKSPCSEFIGCYFFHFSD